MGDTLQLTSLEIKDQLLDRDQEPAFDRRLKRRLANDQQNVSIISIDVC